MILSQACNYGILSMLYIAKESKPGEFISIRKISTELNISFAFLTKILQILTQHGILHSVRGAKGGIALAMPTTEISMYDVIKAIDGESMFIDCILGLPGCGEQKPCPLHHEWAKIRDDLKGAFINRDLADVTVDIRALGLRLHL
jgi:Rrf2 family transcriptional regulator, iron-sulfur cluster assembly transcription factor